MTPSLRSSFTRLLGLPVLFTVPAFLATADSGTALQAIPGAPAQQQCEVTFDPESISVDNDTAAVVATLSLTIGTITDVSFAEGSGIEVESHSPAPMGQEEFRLTLDTEGANEGEWSATFRGSDGTCTGGLRVEADADAPDTQPTPTPSPDPVPGPDTDPVPGPDTDPAPSPDPAPTPGPDTDPAPDPQPTPEVS